ncbi:MAG: LacI family transcriptional regulator [Alphaproteobacteria bacterium]|nr:LacI family transcriptional regulator [Alphaproteobacteria bacterium]
MAGARPTIRAISESVGCSVTTVSMVLSGRAEEFRISAATRDRIIQTAREMNYQPNLHARNLRFGTSNIVAIMVPTLTHRFFSGMAEAFERLARTNGLFPLIIATHHDKTEELDAIDYFISQNVDCVFTANSAAMSEVSKTCRRARLKQIVIDAHNGGGGHVVTTDSFAAAQVLTTRLLQRIAAAKKSGPVYFVGGMPDHSVTRRRLDGFLAALSAHAIAFEGEKPFVPTPFNAGQAREVFADMFARSEKFAGIFVNSLAVMEGLLLYFRQNRERCREVRYAVFDYHPFMEAVDLDYVCVRQNAETMMSMAFSIYLKGLDAGGDQIHFAPYELIESEPIR